MYSVAASANDKDAAKARPKIQFSVNHTFIPETFVNLGVLGALVVH
jgi:hypothetical protein